MHDAVFMKMITAFVFLAVNLVIFYLQIPLIYYIIMYYLLLCIFYVYI